MQRTTDSTDRLSAARKPLPIADALALGEQLALALADRHRRGLVHGGVRPQVIGWRSATARATLLDDASSAPDPGEGSALERLRYIAPEQTGRLDLAVDARSDLYALGAVLYEALTGVPPVGGAGDPDALALTHALIAGTVVPPTQRDPSIPRLLSDLVMRLLAKAPDDRYQSASGLEHDLARCAGAWAEHGDIEPFTLGERDTSPRLVFGSRLVGRERETATLLAAFERCRAGGRALVLVQGYAGVGKTALIHQLVQPIVRSHGHFIAGKFDQVVRGVPFGALIQAFQALVRQLLGESEERLAVWRSRLLDALGANAGVLTEVIPDVALIVGAQPPPPALDAAEAQNRFQRVLQRFVAALATPEQPLVLFLDDLQWADAATLALLEPLATSPDIGSVLLLAAFRDHEVEAVPRLARLLATLRSGAAPDTGYTLEHLPLEPLTPGDLAGWLAGVLRCPAGEAAPLASLVHAKTGGNPFFAMQFLQLLEREGLLRPDAIAGRWSWQPDAIDRLPLGDNVVELMTRRIQRLPSTAQYMLTLAACIGNRFDVQTLATVSEQAPTATTRELQQALAEGLLVASDDGYAFLHDRVQQAAYALIPAERRRMVHLSLGRLLRARASPAQLDNELFDAVHHLNLGRTLIADAAERRDLAALDLTAGRRAKSSTAYEAALELFEAGLDLLDGGAGNDSDLAFELALEGAECRYLCGQIEASLAESGALVARAPTPLAHARVLRLRAVQYENMARYAESLACAREALAPFGVVLPETEAAQQAALAEEMAAIERLRAGRAIAALVELPPMRDEAKRMVMVMLTAVWSSAYLIGSPTLARLISATLVRLSLENGNSEESAYGYVTHAITVGALLSDYRAADQYGRLALAVNHRFDDRRRRAKIYQQFHAHVHFWCHPVRDCVAYAREAHAAGLDSGDFLYAAYAAGTELWPALASTQDLAAFVREYTPSIVRIERLKSPAFADSVRLILAWARALQRSLPLTLADADFDEAAWLARYGETRFFAAIHAVLRLQLAVLLAAAGEALGAARRAEAVIDALPGTVWPVLHEFWHGMALARAAGEASDAGERAAMLDTVRGAQAAFAARVAHNAQNHLPQSLLLAAELARLEGRDADALAACQQAAEFTATAPLLPLQALAHELLARTHRRLEQPALAALQLARARELYLAWGAVAKVASLDTGQAAATSVEAAAAARVSTPPSLAASTPELDLASVLKAAQAIAGEMEMPALLARLLHISIENAGAERGALVLEGEMGSDAGPIVHRYQLGDTAPTAESLPQCRELPLAIIRLVRRTGEAVLLGQKGETATPEAAGGHASFAEDPYLRRHEPRSLACLPVRRQARLAGVLYLEHRRAAGVFTPARLATLRALATQAAISLENAQLVAGLQREVAERRRAQEQLAGALAEVQSLKNELEVENSYLRRDLIANVSHDLRTPLVSLRGYLEALDARGERLSANEKRQYLGVALRQSDRLATLIDELFELARLDFKGFALAREPFALGELASDVVQKFRLAAESRGVRLALTATPPLPPVHADLALVERVLDNLIGNALKHTPAGGDVHVAAYAEGGNVVTEVRDSGCGIAADDLPHIFDRHFRGVAQGSPAAGAASGGKASPGAGLGLAIARRIVELHGGRIAAESAPGEGTRLWFSLPLAASA